MSWKVLWGAWVLRGGTYRGYHCRGSTIYRKELEQSQVENVEGQKEDIHELQQETANLSERKIINHVATANCPYLRYPISHLGQQPWK